MWQFTGSGAFSLIAGIFVDRLHDRVLISWDILANAPYYKLVGAYVL
jgi:hypothetical protein